MQIIYHYPPELVSLLVDTIPLLNRSKKDVILFFKGAGVNETFFNDLYLRILNDSSNVTKYEIVRTIVSRLNDKGESTLRERREILKRVVEFESYEACWESDRLKAKGLVAEVRLVINVKDSFTKMKIEKENLSMQSREEYLKKITEVQKRKKELDSFRYEIGKLIQMKDPHKRGKLFEGVLNRLFLTYNILVREAFTLNGTDNEGVVEQLDGVIELDGNLYLVEMKWWTDPVGKEAMTNHLMGIFLRGQARGLFISVSGFTQPAIHLCKEALSKTTVALCDLHEIVKVIEDGDDLKELLLKKIRASIIDKNPYVRF